MAICPRGHHLVSHNHKRCHDGRQKHGCQSACWAETVRHAFDVGNRLLGTVNTWVCEGILYVNKVVFHFDFLVRKGYAEP
jgi:hypothetical protein